MATLMLFVPSLGGGGAERAVVTLASGFVKAGHDVTLVVAGAADTYSMELDERVKLKFLGKGRVLASAWPLARAIRNTQPKAIISFMLHANIVAVVAKILAGSTARLVVSERIALSFDEYNKGIKSRVMRACMSLLYPKADLIHAVSEGVAEELRRQLRTSDAEVRVVYNPLNIERVRALAHAPSLEMSLPAKDFIVAVGRLEPQKDFTTLLKAFSTVRQHLDCELVILGEGKLRGELEAEAESLNIAEYITFPGFLRNPFNVIAAASVYVLSSKSEGLPNSLLQAMALGVPIVATDCNSGPDEILESGKWGKLVEVGEPEQMAAALLTQMKRPMKINTMESLRRFEERRVVEQYLRLLIVE